MKKFLATALSISMLMCSISTPVFATALDEVGENEVRSKATTVSPTGKVEGKISKEQKSDQELGDIDWYKTTAKADGYFSGTFDCEETVRSFQVAVYTKDSKVPCFHSSSVRTKLDIPKIPVKKGTTIYVKVEADNPYYPPEETYTLKFKTVASSVWEKEENNTKSKATKVTAGKTYYGNIQCAGENSYNSGFSESNDEDYWKYTVTDEGYFNFELKAASIDTELHDIDSGWKVEMYVGSAVNPLYEVEVKEPMKSPNFSFKKGTVVYIKIKSATPQGPRYVDYSLKVNRAKSSYWETEKNNTTATAKKMTVGKTYYGTITNIKKDDYTMDQDYFKVVATKTGKMKLYFGKKNDEDSTQNGWDILIKTKSKTNNLQSVRTKYSAKKAIATIPVKKGEIIFVRVSGPENKYVVHPENVVYALNMKY